LPASFFIIKNRPGATMAGYQRQIRLLTITVGHSRGKSRFIGKCGKPPG